MKTCQRQISVKRKICTACEVVKNLHKQGLKVSKEQAGDFQWDAVTNTVAMDDFKEEVFPGCMVKNCDNVAYGKCNFNLLFGHFKGCLHIVCHEHISSVTSRIPKQTRSKKFS